MILLQSINKLFLLKQMYNSFNKLFTRSNHNNHSKCIHHMEVVLAKNQNFIELTLRKHHSLTSLVAIFQEFQLKRGD